MAESFIFIDNHTSFNGSITAKEVVVEGTVEGDVIAADKVLIKNGGMINGNIITDKLLFEEGGKHNGLIRLGQPVEQNESQSSPQLSQSNSDDEKKDKDKNSYDELNLENEEPKRLW